MWTPPPFALASAPVFTAAELDRYERDILTNVRATEHDARRLFCDLPKFLYMGQGAEIRSEVILYRSDRTAQRVDFFRRSYGKRFWDVIEIKHPNRPFIASGLGSHSRISNFVETAINQALDYRELINESIETRAQLARRGILVYRPQVIVIVGKDGRVLSPERLEALHDRIRARGLIDAYSYEDIYEFALEHFRSNQVLVTLVTTFFSPETRPQTAVPLPRHYSYDDLINWSSYISPGAMEMLGYFYEKARGLGYDISSYAGQAEEFGKELADVGLIEPSSWKDGSFKLTCKGWKVIDQIHDNSERRWNLCGDWGE